MVNRVVVGAHYGLGSWLVQRVSAIVIAVYAVIMAIALLGGHAHDYAAWKALFGQGWLRFATFLFVVSLLLHAWVGMRDIWMDYVKSTGLRLTLEALTVLWLVGCGGWALQILWR
ncbi:MAG TPA: succinate dehydrogenase, hydrophobic membrane anchor protein [Burkholderiales bacterium]|nr:succinate dehydrogenase, hydrophobic membrane anchor protein [Burkholderiales bacterium]